ncbi:MAG: Bax inhibitor-1/YccA family protein [Alphaproteobacteria bacterium]|nr:Bax inhibitor-1/YccA family protein [Alphaproteobacteria bacterium]
MSDLNARDFATQRTTGMAIDQGLRSYMLKVYNYMTTGLLMTAFVGYLIANTPLFNLFYTLQGNVYTLNVLGWIAVISPLILVFAINPVIASGRMKAAFLVFMLFSALMGVSLANVLLAYTGVSVARIFFITAAMFAAMSLYGYTTKKDLTGMGSFLMMGLIGIIIAMVVNWFLKSPALYYGISIIGVFIFVGLTAYDTQKIRQMYYAGDAQNVMMSKAVMGALSLYLDFINLFFMLISLFGDRR